MMVRLLRLVLRKNHEARSARKNERATSRKLDREIAEVERLTRILDGTKAELAVAKKQIEMLALWQEREIQRLEKETAILTTGKIQAAARVHRTEE